MFASASGCARNATREDACIIIQHTHPKCVMCAHNSTPYRPSCGPRSKREKTHTQPHPHTRRPIDSITQAPAHIHTHTKTRTHLISASINRPLLRGRPTSFRPWMIPGPGTECAFVMCAHDAILYTPSRYWCMTVLPVCEGEAERVCGCVCPCVCAQVCKQFVCAVCVSGSRHVRANKHVN